MRVLLSASAVFPAWALLSCGEAAGAAAAAGPGAGAEADLEIELRLLGALEAGGETALPALLLDLARTGGRWERVWGTHSNNRKPTLYTGRVTRAEVTADRVQLALRMRLKGPSAVEVDARRSADGGLEGTYSIAGATPVAGRADGRVKPPRPPLPEGFVPVRPGERPRILVRASDVPALREKLKTPLGRALFDRMGDEKSADAIGEGLRYVLTGEGEHAEKARLFAERNMTGKVGGYSMRTAAGRVPQQVAVAYDLCRDAWPEDFRRKAEEYLANEGERCLRGRGFSGGYNWHVSSNWGAKVFQAAGFIGLALWGEKGPPPERPGADADLPEWEEETEEWRRLGGFNARYHRIFEESRHVLYLHNREAIGTGGFRGECAHYGLKAMEMQIEYAACYRRMFGRDLSPYPDAALALPRMMFCHSFPEDEGARPVPLDINGWSQLWGNMLTYGYPLCPDGMKGAYLWAWNRRMGVAGPEDLAKLVAAKGPEEQGLGDAAWLFLSYPAAARPSHPSESMPLTWFCPDHGFYGFRSGWKGRDDFVLLVHARAHSPGGWNGPNTGTFRLAGLGQSWNDTYSGREICAWEENRVMLPEDPFWNGGLGRVTRVAAAPDGSGAVGIDMSDAYNPTPSRAYSMYGNVRDANAFRDAPIRALRAFAVDYSGKCGAPCLFALVDRIAGGKSRLWAWNLGDAAVVPKVAVSGNAFSIPRGEGLMRGTFVAPRPAGITAVVNDGKDQPGHNCGQRDKTPPRKVPTLFARGGDDFFLVATIQEASKAPPEVKVEGEGLSAVATVGARRVVFDGARLVIADAP